jgi:hypothetical protein
MSLPYYLDLSFCLPLIQFFFLVTLGKAVLPVEFPYGIQQLSPSTPDLGKIKDTLEKAAFLNYVPKIHWRIF